MGELKNLAKRNSNWLQFNVGESVIVKFMDYKIIPSTLDPTKDTVQYKVLENGAEKYWTNGSGKIMAFFDDLEKGKVWVKISRNPWIDKNGKVTEGKSSYAVELAQEPPKAEKAWDE